MNRSCLCGYYIHISLWTSAFVFHNFSTSAVPDGFQSDKAPIRKLPLPVPSFVFSIRFFSSIYRRHGHERIKQKSIPSDIVIEQNVFDLYTNKRFAVSILLKQINFQARCCNFLNSANSNTANRISVIIIAIATAVAE